MIIHNTTQFYSYLDNAALPPGIPQLQGPACEPVTVAEVKAFMKVFISQDDDLIGELITDARVEVEAACQRCLITQQFAMAQTRFPPSNVPITLLRAPAQSVQSVSYCTTNNVVDFVTMTSPIINGVGDVPQVQAEYVFVPGAPGRINRLWGWWPVVNQFRSDAIRVVYTCGYGATPEAVPRPLKLAIKMLVHAWYDNRPGIQPVISENLKGLPLPLSVENIVQKYSYGSYPE